MLPGSFSGGWIYERYFAPALAAQGWEVLCHTFRSHQRSPLYKHTLGLEDFADEVSDVIHNMPSKPWVFAHSLGGRVVLEYLTRTRRNTELAGLVLLSPAPPDGMWRVASTMAHSDPAGFAKFAAMSVIPGVQRVGQAPKGVYSKTMDAEDVRYCNKRLSNESSRALMEAQMPMWRNLGRIKVPVFVIGTEGDQVIPASSVRHTASLLKADCTILPGSSHMMMVDTGWEDVLDTALNWISVTEHAL